MDNLINRFIKYVKVKTTSDPESMSIPSTKDQLDLAKILKDELIELGLTNVVLDDKGYVYGLLKSNSDKKIKLDLFLIWTQLQIFQEKMLNLK